MTNVDVLIVEDDPDLRETLSDILQIAGYSILTAENGRDALDRLSVYNFRLILTDVQMYPMDGMELLKRVRKQNQFIPVIVMTAYGTIEKAVDAMRFGASDYLVKPFEGDALIEVVQRFLPDISDDVDTNCKLIVNEESMQSLKALVSRVAKTDATVLLCGESGVGKEVFARYIHNESSRVDESFVAINCAAIPENMLESILFGYEKGSFTGAHQASAGKFEQAQNGTLLLDEISEMDIGLQAKLLRVLQEKEVERLGGRKTISLNVRVIATTNKNLREEVAAGRFREDLFYRLSVFPVLIPALRDRISDIVPIAENLLEKHTRSTQLKIELTREAQQKLIRHQWSGNVRELDNVMQRAVILKEGNQITEEHIHFETTEMFNKNNNSVSEDESQDSVLVSDLKDREQKLILEALRVGNGSRKYAAERLGISPRTLRYKLARMRDVGIAV
ncbi:MAG: sigma-54 dependent transcriptional regulator [Gammaproteobacteria bacterium]|nr:sigma-54 dependent transcriptional regulator [Gammaproteobacteria bacterium]